MQTHVRNKSWINSAPSDVATPSEAKSSGLNIFQLVTPGGSSFLSDRKKYTPKNIAASNTKRTPIHLPAGRRFNSWSRNKTNSKAAAKKSNTEVRLPRPA